MQTENNSSNLLDSLKCPITYELFRDPVIGGDGHTYERENITAWIREHATSPITREPMTLSSLRSNYIVKKMVEDFVSLSLQKQYQFRLDVDVCKSKPRPIFQSPGKTIYEAKWMLKHGPSIILIKIDGAKAKHEASFYVKLSCHPHIVRTYGLVDSNSSDSIMLVQEYAPEGDLSELLRSNHFRPTMNVLLEIFWQIVNAMICLADNQIIHGDLACRNVLVFRSSSNQPPEMLVKLTDFGLTRAGPLFSVIDSPASATMPLIPIRSAAPEILLDTSSSSYSEKSDVYSFGVLMWEACSGGATPYGYIEASKNVYAERLKGKLLERPTTCSNEFWDIILNCTQQDPHKRPNFKTIEEYLLTLRFQNRRESVNRISQVDANYINITNITLPTNNLPGRSRSQSYNQESSPNSPVYNNLNNSSSKFEFSQSTSSKQTLCEYYTPCEYCSESINTENFDTHKDVCSVRRVAKLFAKFVARLPLLEITSCIYCEHLIPLNMIDIHQHTCDNNPNYFHNKSQILPQQPPVDSYVSFIYLKPVSLPKSSTEGIVNVYATIPSEQIQRPKSTIDIQSELSNQSSTKCESTGTTSIKPPKSGLRKAFSKLKLKSHRKD